MTGMTHDEVARMLIFYNLATCRSCLKITGKCWSGYQPHPEAPSLHTRHTDTTSNSKSADHSLQKVCSIAIRTNYDVALHPTSHISSWTPYYVTLPSRTKKPPVSHVSWPEDRYVSHFPPSLLDSSLSTDIKPPHPQYSPRPNQNIYISNSLPLSYSTAARQRRGICDPGHRRP